MKHLSILVVSSFFAFALAAQTDESKDYKKMKEDLNTRIFQTPDADFKDNRIPDEYKNESAVVLAQKHTLESDSKFKYRLGFFAGAGHKFTFMDIFRKKLLINDQSALKEFSELNFKKLQSKQWSPLGKLKNYTFINIRLIKPDGKIKTIDVDESAVTLKDEKNEKQNKIAIPDLSVGDILEYYVANYYQEEQEGNTNSLNYVFGDDYPILKYVLSLQFDTRIAVEYQCINGAPDFKIAPDADGGGNVLSLSITNIPKIKGLIWSSILRQLPIIRINYKQGAISLRDQRDIKEGNVLKANNQFPDMIEGDMAAILNAVCYNGAVATRFYKEDKSQLKKAWKEYRSAHPRADSPDSIAAFVFRYMTWSDYFGAFDLRTDYTAAYFPQSLQGQLYRIAKFANIVLGEFKIDLDLLILPGRDSYARENLFNVADLSVLVRTNSGKPQYFSFADNLDYGNLVPYSLQGMEAKVFPFYKKNAMMGDLLSVSLKGASTARLPATDYKTNVEFEAINVRIDTENPLLLDVTRKVNVQGALKKDEQAGLANYEQMADELGANVGVTGDLLTQNKNRPRSSRDPEDELKSLIEKARSKNKGDFENEIERSYDIRAKEVKNYKILGFGAVDEHPFEYQEEFVMDGWVKKAGDNYIVDLGKLLSSQLEVKGDQRDRVKDIYMPFPRSFGYRIEFAVPEGYTVQGLDKLNSSVENETGAFISTAKIDNNKLVVEIRKYYTDFFEPANKWKTMLSFLDKGVEFNQQKILIKKL